MLSLRFTIYDSIHQQHFKLHPNFCAGLGSWELMGNAWGFDGSQRYPPSLMPYHKAILNWLNPVEIVEEGIYTLPPSHAADFVYVIQMGPEGEYLMLENRQRYSFEAKNPEGLLIYHIDEAATNYHEGFPEMGGWPENGKHYKYSIIGADGRYDLERGKGFGDDGDVFRHDSVNGIGPYGTISVDGTLKAPYPRTMSYQKGKIQATGHYILNVSAPDANKSISFSFKTCLECGFNGNGTAAPTSLPPTISSTDAPTLSPTLGPTTESISDDADDASATTSPSPPPSSSPAIGRNSVDERQGSGAQPSPSNSMDASTPSPDTSSLRREEAMLSSTSSIESSSAFSATLKACSFCLSSLIFSFTFYWIAN